MSKRYPRCSIHAHDWQPMKRGGAHEQCTKCHDIFPCRHDCDHLDCIVATGREFPAHVIGMLADPIVARAAVLDELMIVAPTVIAAYHKQAA